MSRQDIYSSNTGNSRMRPNSAELADLHVYIVPPDLWRERYNNLLNQNVTETISAGIIRVHPDTRVCNLRDELESQLGAELLPRDYIFLKSVGRSITRLKPKQEFQLKVKHFLPPNSYAPELYLLEVENREDENDTTGSTRPTTRSPQFTESEDERQSNRYRQKPRNATSPYRYTSPLPKIKSGRGDVQNLQKTSASVPHFDQNGDLNGENKVTVNNSWAGEAPETRRSPRYSPVNARRTPPPHSPPHQNEYPAPHTDDSHLNTSPPHSGDKPVASSHQPVHSKFDPRAATYTNQTNDSGIAGLTPEEYRENYDDAERRKNEYNESRQKDLQNRLNGDDSDHQRHLQEEKDRDEWERKRREEEERRRREEEDRRRREEEERQREEDERRRREEEREKMAREKLSGSDEGPSTASLGPVDPDWSKNGAHKEPYNTQTNGSQEKKQYLYSTKQATDQQSLDAGNRTREPSSLSISHQTGEQRSLNTTRQADDQRSLNTSQLKGEQRSLNTGRQTEEQRFPNTSRQTEEQRFPNMSRQTEEQRSLDTSRQTEEQRSLNTSGPTEEHKSLNTGQLTGDPRSLNMSHLTGEQRPLYSGRQTGEQRSLNTSRQTDDQRWTSHTEYGYDQRSSVQPESQKSSRNSSKPGFAANYDQQHQDKYTNNRTDIDEGQSGERKTDMNVNQEGGRSAREDNVRQPINYNKEINRGDNRDRAVRMNDGEGDLDRSLASSGNRRITNSDASAYRSTPYHNQSDSRLADGRVTHHQDIPDEYHSYAGNQKTYGLEEPVHRKVSKTFVKEDIGYDPQYGDESNQRYPRQESNDSNMPLSPSPDSDPNKKSTYRNTQGNSDYRSDAKNTKGGNVHQSSFAPQNRQGRAEPQKQGGKPVIHHHKQGKRSDLNRFPSPPPMNVSSSIQGQDSSNMTKEQKQAETPPEPKEEPKPPQKSLKKKPSFIKTKGSKKKDPEEEKRLLQELEAAREARRAVERQREELVKKAKLMQNKTQNRRNHARDLWKKRYFEEKKRTPPLEEQCNKLRHELDVIHRKLMNSLEGSSKDKNTRVENLKPSKQNNYKIQATRLTHEIDDLRRRLENAKMKLTAEMKLRNQAETELRALRAELTQKKIHLTLARNQQIGGVTPSDNRYFRTPALSNRA